MSAEKQDLVLQEMLANEVNAHVRSVKEEIRAVFAGHMNTLVSREQWLLDQADSIKEGIIALITKRQISAVKAKAKLEGYMEFMKFSKDQEQTKNLMKKLQKKIEESSCCPQDSSLPAIQFVHDRALMHNSLVSYGKVETGDPLDGFDQESMVSDKSWDVLKEKTDDMYKMEQDDKSLELGDSYISESTRCCGGTGNCFQPFYEIEDMDFTKFLHPSIPDVENDATCREVLKNVCKANELCSSFNECVCDTPCYCQGMSDQMTESADDPVSRLHSKLEAIYASEQTLHESLGMEEEPKEFSKDVDPVLKVHKSMEIALQGTKQPRSGNNEVDIIDQLSRKLQCILDTRESESTPVTSEMPSFELERSNSGKNLIQDIHFKISSILSGEHVTDSPVRYSACDVKVMNGFEEFAESMNSDVSSQERPDENHEEKYCGEIKSTESSCNVDLMKLNQRLANICRAGNETAKRPELNPILDEPRKCDQHDPVQDLAAKLQQIISC